MSAQSHPKIQRGLIVLSAALIGWAMIPLPSFVPVLHPALIVPPQLISSARILAALLSTLFVWYAQPLQAPRANVRWTIANNKAILRVTNSGPATGEFYASGILPALDPSSFPMAWRGKDKKVTLAPKESDDIWLAEIDGQGSFDILTFDNAGRPYRLRIKNSKGRIPDYVVPPTLGESPGYIVVTIYTVPQPYMSWGWAWKGRLNLPWDGAKRLDIQCLEELRSPLWGKAEPPPFPPTLTAPHDTLALQFQLLPDNNQYSAHSLTTYPTQGVPTWTEEELTPKDGIINLPNFLGSEQEDSGNG